MNILDDVVSSISREYPHVSFSDEQGVRVFNNLAFSYTDLELTPIVARGISRAKFLDYKSRGITLFQLTSDVSAVKIKHFIISKLQLREKIYARQCAVKEISQEAYDRILSKYHIQGKAKSHVRLALYYKDTIVAAVGFNKTPSGWLLNRLVFAEYAVVGGASKLVSAFRRAHTGMIETFSANAYSDGGVYASIGFSKQNENTADMWYVDKLGKLLNRRKFQKQYLQNILENFDSGITETENMINNGFGVYYGSGTIRWTL